jgi:hypothetical protein
MKKILIGNSFSMALIRRKARIKPCSKKELLDAAKDAKVFSFWGHDNSLEAAIDFSGIDLAPENSRPVLKLSENLLPELDGIEFEECWLLSPNYKDNFRPAIGEEVDARKIKDWTVLKIKWE